MLLRLVRALAKKLNPFVVKTSVVGLYDDRLWPWLRRFLVLWAWLLLYWGAALLLDAYGISPVSHKYAYGLVRFWFFYVPVFGFFMQVFYSNYDELGVWTPGPSYTTGVRSVLRDLFGR
jgi:hypothetical protein